MDRVFVGIVVMALLFGGVTAALLQPEVAVTEVDDLRAANSLLAIKAGCYLLQLPVVIDDGNTVASLQQPGTVRDAARMVLQGVDAVPGRVRIDSREQATVWLDAGLRQVSPAEAVAAGLAGNATVTVRTAFLKRAGDNVCMGDAE